MSRQRSFTEHMVFLIASLAAALMAPTGAFLYLVATSRVDGAAIFNLAIGAAILGAMVLAAVEFETDGVASWMLTPGGRTPQFRLGYFAGLVLKVLAILHGVAALIGGGLLALDTGELPARVSSWPEGIGSGLRVALVVWLWVMTAVAYLAGDGWICRSRRTDEIESL